MKTSPDSSTGRLRGIAALFDDFERKALFHKYLFFLGWIEILILATCWLYRLSDRGSDPSGPVDTPFPWKVYFLVAFLAPVAITFLLGVVIVGFNKYFGEPETIGQAVLGETPSEGGGERTGGVHKLHRWVHWIQGLPFLGLLLLLGVAVGFFYRLDDLLAFLSNVGEKSVKIVLISAAALVALISVFALILILLNFQLRKKSMEYRYRSEMAERFGLIILEDNTVLNNEGKLVSHGKKLLPLLPSEAPQGDRPEIPGRPLRTRSDPDPS